MSSVTTLKRSHTDHLQHIIQFRMFKRVLRLLMLHSPGAFLLASSYKKNSRSQKDKTLPTFTNHAPARSINSVNKKAGHFLNPTLRSPKTPQSNQVCLRLRAFDCPPCPFHGLSTCPQGAVVYTTRARCRAKLVSHRSSFLLSSIDRG